MKRAHIGSGLQKKETPRPQEDSRDQRNEENTEENILENEEENGQNQLNDENAGPSKKRKRTSLIWNHFTIKFLQEENAEFAFCNYCNKKPIRLGGRSNASTGNLIRHLKGDHSDIYSVGGEKAQEKFVFSQERYRESLIKWIINSDQPFCECQQEDFVELLKSLNPEAKHFSAQTVKRDIMKKFEECVAERKIRLSKVSSKFAFTVDAWTSKNVLPFMDIRAHWINDDWTYESVVVDFSFIEGDHAGKNLCKIFVDCLKRFEIPLSKVSAVTMDNVSSNDTFMDYLRKHSIDAGTNLSKSHNRIRCLPHVLNLAVQDILSELKIPLNDDVDHSQYLDDLEEEEMAKLACAENSDEDNEDHADDVVEDECNDATVPKLRKLIKKLRKSPQMREKLKKICELYEQKYLVPVIDVGTRWDSTFDMIERAIYLKAPIDVMCSKEKKLKNLSITSGEWSELNTLRSLLKKFRRSTKFMSMERHPTISAYLPTFEWIVQSVESFIRENPGPLASAANAGLLKLKKYQDEFQLSECKTIYIAVFLNPALKLNYFKEHGYSKAHIKDIQKAICEVLENNYGSEACDTVDNDNESEPDEFFSHMFKRKSSREPKEFQKYLNHPLSNTKVDVLDYWRSQKDEFPKLSRMAQDYLAIQGSSVPVERDFSMGTHLVTSTRCSLHPKTISACMCLKSWLKERKLTPLAGNLLFRNFARFCTPGDRRTNGENINHN